MGLDNGVIVKNFPTKDSKNFPSFIKSHLATDADGNVCEIDLCYWRKCWGLRDSIYESLCSKYGNDLGIYSIDEVDVKLIINKIKYFMYPDHWKEEGESIWEYDEYIDILIDNCLCLSWLYEYWKEHPNIFVMWYDSY